MLIEEVSEDIKRAEKEWNRKVARMLETRRFYLSIFLLAILNSLFLKNLALTPNIGRSGGLSSLSMVYVSVLLVLSFGIGWIGQKVFPNEVSQVWRFSLWAYLVSCVITWICLLVKDEILAETLGGLVFGYFPGVRKSPLSFVYFYVGDLVGYAVLAMLATEAGFQVGVRLRQRRLSSKSRS